VVTAKTLDPVDVVIVGAGAAGVVYAAKLASAGKSVVILEAGPPWTMGDLISSQIWARRLRWGGPFIETTGDNPVGFGYNAGWGVGGAALHHYGTWPRLHESDFKVRSQHGRGLDWPINYADLRSWYDLVQAEVGISGDAEAEVWRPPGAPYPLPPIKQFPQSEVLKRGFAALEKRVAPAPMAITTAEYNGRPECLYDGWCDAGCPIQALANPQTIYLPIAEGAGAQIRANSPVTRLLARSADVIDAVEYRDGEGQLYVQPAKIVVLAASVTGNPGILLNSRNSWHPNGLGNARDQVGRYVQTHGLVSIVGLFPEETTPHLGVFGAHLICHDDYAKDGTAGAFGSRQWLIAPSIKPNDLAGLAVSRSDLWGPALDAFMRRAVKHAANMIGMIEDLPHADNRVELTGKLTPWGVSGVRLVHRFDADAKALWQAHKAQGLEIFRRAGAVEGPWASPMNSAHLMGGTIMGDDPATSVTDAFGRVHGLRNLVVGGPGLFPTSGAVNPTYTVHALAARSAADILDRWGDYTV
jgi:choline dehydrogenase-like flavoprotein